MKILGGILLGIGILIAGVSGLCSLVLLADPSTWSGPDMSENIAIVGIVGGIPFALGVAIVLLGLFVLKKGKSDDR